MAVARWLQSMRKTIPSPFFPSSTKPSNHKHETLTLYIYCTSLSSSSQTHSSNAFISPTLTQTRQLSYAVEMRKSAYEGHILRLIRNEINYELERGGPAEPVAQFGPFLIDDRPGEQWITLRRKFGENEDIKVEATMFEEFFPVSKPGSVPGDVELRISLVITISKGEASDVLEIVCTVWPGSIEINKLFTRSRTKMPAQPYLGPGFKELDDGLQDYLYKFLEERGIDEELAFFLHEYMKNKDKTEYIKWMETVKSFVERKV